MIPVNIRAHRVDIGRRIDLYALTSDGKQIGKSIVMGEYEDGLFHEPIASLHTNEAQQLMDDLWQAGIRPSEGSGSAGSLAATEKHLNDMRAIAFKKLNIEKE